MKTFPHILTVFLALGASLTALAQATPTPEKKTFTVGIQEERPQFLPDSAKLVIPKPIQELETKVKANPKNVDLKFDLLMAYSRTSLLDRAWPQALKIDKLDPNYTLKVLKDTETKLKKDPTNPDLRYRSAMASFARSWQLKEAARDAYMAPMYEKGQPLPTTWWEDFKTYLKQGDPEVGKRLERPDVVKMLDEVRSQRLAAEGQLQEILKRDSKQSWAKSYLAFLNFDRGDLKQAESLIREAIATDPENPLSYFALGQLFLQQGQLKEAVQQLNIAFELRKQGK